jgi:hypothetical protein
LSDAYNIYSNQGGLVIVDDIIFFYNLINSLSETEVQCSSNRTKGEVVKMLSSGTYIPSKLAPEDVMWDDDYFRQAKSVYGIEGRINEL